MLWDVFVFVRVSKILCPGYIPASKWMDVIDLVHSQDLDVLDQRGNMASDVFLSLCGKEKEKNASFGISFR